MANVFDNLNALNVNDHTEKKEGLTYLSWSWAWAEVKKRYPAARYEIKMIDGKPYVYDPLTGYMVFTTVTIEDVTHEMWLPVMDSANHAMKSEPYTIQTKYKSIEVKPATMFDINKAIMRCLTKNLAMFGLGLYIYAGEDLPEGEEEPKKPNESGAVYPAPAMPTKEEAIKELKEVLAARGSQWTGSVPMEDLPVEHLVQLIAKAKGRKIAK